MYNYISVSMQAYKKEIEGIINLKKLDTYNDIKRGRGGEGSRGILTYNIGRGSEITKKFIILYIYSCLKTSHQYDRLNHQLNIITQEFC